MPSIFGNTDRVWSWQVPPREAPGEYRKGWYDELTQNGENWVQSQQGMRQLHNDIKLLMGYDQNRDMESNLIQPDVRTFVETISDLSQIATLGTKAQQAKQSTQLFNDAFRYIYWDSEFVFNTRRTLQWSLLGRGYMWQKVSRDKYGLGETKARFDALGPREGLPEQLPPDNDIGGCYAFTVIRPMPLAEAHARFPQFQEWLQPVGQYDWSKVSLGSARLLDFYDRYRFMGTSDQNNWDRGYCLIRYHWIRDLRINDTGYTQQVGVDGTSWGYQVPSVGNLIVRNDPRDNMPTSHKATIEECRMYPMLRLGITCPTVPVPMYDDTAFDNHSEIPVVQYDVNDWAWAATGQSIVSNVRSLEVNRRDRLSDINTVLAVRKNPPLGHEISAGVSRTQLENLDLLHAQGIRLGLKGKINDSIGSILPKEIDVTEVDYKGVELLSASIKAGLGLNDIASLRDMKAQLGDNSFEKFITNLGPIAHGISINLWRANSRHAGMLKYNIAQYYRVQDLIDMIGPEGIGIETYDSEPTTIIPSHLPGEDANHSSRATKIERARWYLSRIKVISKPEQLLNITDTQEKMLNMMFLQKGIPVSMERTMGKLGVDDYQESHEQWQKEQLADALWKIEVEGAVAAKIKELGLQPPPDAGGPGQGKGGGRPNSGKKPAHPEQKGSKDGKVRVVNSTS